MDTNLLENEIYIERINPFFKKELKNTTTLKELLNFSISDLRGFTPEMEIRFKKNDCLFSIKELKNLSIKEIDEIVEKLGIDVFDLERFVISSKIILEIVNKKEIRSKKINLIGLDNAGKTAMRETFFRRYGKTYFEFLKTMELLLPTKGVERKKLEIENSDIQFWDMGGQETYRKQYLSEPYRVFSDVNVAIYVIDVQDVKRYEKSLNYLENIIKIYEYLKEKPYFIICIHKFDPAICDETQIKNNLQNLEEKIKDLLENSIFKFEILNTSIYDDFTIFNVFSKGVGKIADKNAQDIINIYLKNQANKMDLNNIILLNKSGVRLGLWAENTDTSEKLYNYAINFLGTMNIEIIFNRKIEIIDSIDVNLGKNNIFTLIVKKIKDILLFFACIHKNNKKFDIKGEDSIIPWLNNLIC